MGEVPITLPSTHTLQPRGWAAHPSAAHPCTIKSCWPYLPFLAFWPSEASWSQVSRRQTWISSGLSSLWILPGAPDIFPPHPQQNLSCTIPRSSCVFLFFPSLKPLNILAYANSSNIGNVSICGWSVRALGRVFTWVQIREDARVCGSQRLTLAVSRWPAIHQIG